MNRAGAYHVLFIRFKPFVSGRKREARFRGEAETGFSGEEEAFAVV